MESIPFNAEVGKVLKIVINSLYTDKDIFLRELVSNASDACDKLRYMIVQGLNDNLLVSSDTEFRITISMDKKNKILFVQDNGIGMNKEDLIKNLGTIAKSGTQQFLSELSNKNSKDNFSDQGSLIGQFGVGFYSVFMVADKVVVESKKIGEKQGYRWVSNGEDSFYVEESDLDFSNGTRICIYLKKDAVEYLDKFKIEHIITTYSEYIMFPIEFVNDNGDKEQLNSGIAIWNKPKAEVTPEQHQDFFRSVAHVGGSPWMVMHNKNEGTIEYTNLLYIPSVKPFDLFHPDRKCSVKLFVRNVFVTEDNVKLIPQYLRFLKGVVDCKDLPLNISRETLQQNVQINKIRKSLVKKVLSCLKKSLEKNCEEYTKFWENFGAVLKEGLCEATDTESRETLMGICRFYTTFSGGKLDSIDNYISRMAENQKYIYYFIGSNIDSMMKSPQIEGFLSRKIEVVLLTDPVDDFWTTVISEYKDKKLMSVTNSSVDLDNVDDNSSEEGDVVEDDNKENYDSEPMNILIKYIKKVLGDDVAEVKISKKLTDSPICLAIKDGGMDMRMERFLIEQKQLNYKTPKIFEINPSHPLITKLADIYSRKGESFGLSQYIRFLFDLSCVSEGENLSDIPSFVERSISILSEVLN